MNWRKLDYKSSSTFARISGAQVSKNRAKALDRRKKHLVKCEYCLKEFLGRSDARSASGFQRFCSRICFNAAPRPWQRAEKNHRWLGGVSKDNYRYTKRFRERFAHKHKAHKTVRDAIRDGILERKPCEVCGSNERIHAHHDDYSNPLDVKWLCQKHHNERHNELRKAGLEVS